MIQYALVGSLAIFIPDTDRFTKDEILERAKAKGAGSGSHIFRYDRCPACEAWTKSYGRLREEIDCPAVNARIAEGRS
jgi:hypothetical protein